MKRFLLLITLTCTHAVHPFTYSDKTFLTPRSDGMSMPEQSSIWHPHITNEIGNGYGVSMHVSPFYHGFSSKKETGKYFGSRRNNTISISPEAQSISALDRNNPTFADFPAESIVHNPDRQGDSPINATVTLRPDRHVYGALFALFYDLKRVADGLSFQLYMPVTHVHHKMRIETCGITSEDGIEIQSYLAGLVEQTDVEKQQLPLLYSKIPCKSESKTGIADVIATVHYNFIQTVRHSTDLHAGILIPTSNRQNGINLFEPVLGMGNAFGLIVGGDSSTLLYNEDEKQVEIMWRAKLVHLFSESQRRVIGVRAQDRGPITWNRYRLAAQLDKAKVFPFANVLLHDLEVRPGNMFEGAIAVAFRYRHYSATLGVDLYGREEEHVKLKDCFEEDQYGLVSSLYDTTNPFTVNDLEAGEILINKSMLDLNAAKTPAQASAKIYASIGYAGIHEDYPVMLGLGVGYEFAGNNSAFDGASVWGTAGISF